MAWQRVDGELVLLAIEGKQLMGLNEVGARIWDLIDDERDLHAIAARIAEEFLVDSETASRDVEAFVAELVRRGAVVLHERP